MAKLNTDPEGWLTRNLSKKSKVLLINPPVHERRYHWLRWNQPAELLKLGGWLQTKHKAMDVRLFDFMLPDAAGSVRKHKVKETWSGIDGDQGLWHFGNSFEDFERWLGAQLQEEGWSPDLVVITSLTSYWHEPIEKLLPKLCTRLGRKGREKATIALYGNYPRLEPEHAACQFDADIAFTRTVDTKGVTPAWRLYEKRPPLFYGLDATEPLLADQVLECWEHHRAHNPKVGKQRPPTMRVAFLNDDVWAEGSRIPDVAKLRADGEVDVAIDGIAGIIPKQLTTSRLVIMKEAGFASLFVEHARTPGGGLRASEYEPLQAFLREEEHAKRTGKSALAWLDGAVTAFVAVGMKDDDLDKIVETTLVLNSYFQSIILKPFGYSPSIDPASARERAGLWPSPALGSPQRFPYVRAGSKLSHEDYNNLLAWQNLLNKRVKGATFDFLGNSLVQRLVRDTLVSETWKPHKESA